MELVKSFKELEAKTGTLKRSILLLYKSGSELSECAMTNLSTIHSLENENFKVLAADVSQVRDIHGVFGITTVPAVLLFERGSFVNVIKGCQDADYYRAIAEKALFQASAKSSGKPMKSVRVYTTPTCSWCNTLKAFLRKNGIPFTEIDVARDEQAAAEMVRSSGQQGVPQTEINGQMVVGFNQPKLKELLEMQ